MDTCSYTEYFVTALRAMQCMDEVETELELVGVTAIEDKLQAQVPASIATLLDAGIKARLPVSAREDMTAGCPCDFLDWRSMLLRLPVSCQHC